MKLKNLLDKINCTEIYGDVDVEIKNISINSKKAEKGSLFVAIEGFKCDGHDFIEEAVSAGASAVVTQKRVNIPSNITQVVVNNTRKALPLLCRNFY